MIPCLHAKDRLNLPARKLAPEQAFLISNSFHGPKINPDSRSVRRNVVRMAFCREQDVSPQDRAASRDKRRQHDTIGNNNKSDCPGAVGSVERRAEHRSCASNGG